MTYAINNFLVFPRNSDLCSILFLLENRLNLILIVAIAHQCQGGVRRGSGRQNRVFENEDNTDQFALDEAPDNLRKRHNWRSDQNDARNKQQVDTKSFEPLGIDGGDEFDDQTLDLLSRQLFGIATNQDTTKVWSWIYNAKSLLQELMPYIQRLLAWLDTRRNQVLSSSDEMTYENDDRSSLVGENDDTGERRVNIKHRPRSNRRRQVRYINRQRQAAFRRSKRNRRKNNHYDGDESETDEALEPIMSLLDE